LKKFMLIILLNFSLSLRRERMGVRVNINFSPSPASPPARGGENHLWNYLLSNSKGISVIFLIIAMLLMVTIGYVFSYLIPTKQKSVRFQIYSPQAFYIAQSGVEFGIRYCSDRGWRGATDGAPARLDLDRLNDAGNNQRNLGNGSFTINYNTGTNILTSTGQITGSSENRVVRVSNFSPFLRLIFDPASPAPQWTLGTRRAQFYFRNVRGTSITLTAFSASWTQTGVSRRITRINLDGVQKYAGTYYSGDPPVNFNRGGNSETVNPNEVITVLIYWNGNIANAANIVITFYSTTGEGYTFNLDSAGNGL